MTEYVAKDHWEALFDRNYLRWFHLNDAPALCEIVQVDGDVELTLPGGKKAKKPVVTLKQVRGKIEDMKPLVLNVANGNSIAAICGPKPSKWPGQKIVLYTTTTVMYDSETKKKVEKPCIRVREPKN